MAIGLVVVLVSPPPSGPGRQAARGSCGDARHQPVRRRVELTVPRRRRPRGAARRGPRQGGRLAGHGAAAVRSGGRGRSATTTSSGPRSPPTPRASASARATTPTSRCSTTTTLQAAVERPGRHRPLGVRREHRHLPRRHHAEGGRTRPGRAGRAHRGPPVVRLARRAARARRRPVRDAAARRRQRGGAGPRHARTPARRPAGPPRRREVDLAGAGGEGRLPRPGRRRAAGGGGAPGVRALRPAARCTGARAASWRWTSTPDGRPGGRPSCWAPART